MQNKEPLIEETKDLLFDEIGDDKSGVLVITRSNSLKKLLSIVVYGGTIIIALVALAMTFAGSIRLFNIKLTIKNIVGYFAHTKFFFANGFKAVFFETLVGCILFVSMIFLDFFIIYESIKGILIICGRLNQKNEDKTKDNDKKMGEKLSLCSGFNAIAVLSGGLTSINGITPIGKIALFIILIIFLLCATLICLISSMGKECSSDLDKFNFISKLFALLMIVGWYVIFLLATFRPGLLQLSVVFDFDSLSFESILPWLISIAKLIIAYSVVNVIMNVSPMKKMLFVGVGVIVLRVVESVVKGTFVFASAVLEMAPTLILILFSFAWNYAFKEIIDLGLFAAGTGLPKELQNSTESEG